LTFSLVGAPAGASITPGGVFTWTPSAGGDYTFEVVVSDGSLTDSETITVHVAAGNIEPVASIAWEQIKTPIRTISFSGNGSSDADGTIVTYSWNWGDGTADGSGAWTTHTYASWGHWWATLTVTDNGGATNSVKAYVEVIDPAIPPPPYSVMGYVYESDGVTPIAGITVVLTDLRTGAIWTAIDDLEPGFYIIDLNTNASAWTSGDTLSITAWTSDGRSGTVTAIAGSQGTEYLFVDPIFPTGSLGGRIVSVMAVDAPGQTEFHSALARVHG
jgi:PKD repeat protein